MLSRFERGQRLPVAARLPALLWIVFFYSLNIPKMVDFRGFKHLDVPEGGRGSGNKHRGVQKSTHRENMKMFYSLTLRESRLLPPLTRAGPAACGCPFTRPAVDRYLKRVTATPAVDPPWRPFFLQPQKVVLNTQPAAAMYRPSQTPRLTRSSERIAPGDEVGSLIPEARGLHPALRSTE
ncbi:hypothetical protein ACOMHN_021172 [Nucella lapillus]